MMALVFIFRFRGIFLLFQESVFFTQRRKQDFRIVRDGFLDVQFGFVFYSIKGEILLVAFVFKFGIVSVIDIVIVFFSRFSFFEFLSRCYILFLVDFVGQVDFVICGYYRGFRVLFFSAFFGYRVFRIFLNFVERIALQVINVIFFWEIDFRGVWWCFYQEEGVGRVRGNLYLLVICRVFGIFIFYFVIFFWQIYGLVLVLDILVRVRI